jgi:hypothetical protein
MARVETGGHFSAPSETARPTGGLPDASRRAQHQERAPLEAKPLRGRGEGEVDHFLDRHDQRGHGGKAAQVFSASARDRPVTTRLTRPSDRLRRHPHRPVRHVHGLGLAHRAVRRCEPPMPGRCPAAFRAGRTGIEARWKSAIIASAPAAAQPKPPPYRSRLARGLDQRAATAKSAAPKSAPGFSGRLLDVGPGGKGLAPLPRHRAELGRSASKAAQPGVRSAEPCEESALRAWGRLTVTG